jgi:hypothetical protein
MIAHLHTHRAAGDRVPDNVFLALQPDPKIGEFERRMEWFERYTDQLEKHSVVAGRDGGPYRCPCCHFKTLPERGGYDICKVCFWEDDGQDDQDAAVVRGGPNGRLSLIEARENYTRFGACDEKFKENVRPPHDSEK